MQKVGWITGSLLFLFFYTLLVAPHILNMIFFRVTNWPIFQNNNSGCRLTGQVSVMTKCWCSTDSQTLIHHDNSLLVDIILTLSLWLYSYDWAYNPNKLFCCTVAAWQFWLSARFSVVCKWNLLNIFWSTYIFANICFSDVLGGIVV